MYEDKLDTRGVNMTREEASHNVIIGGAGAKTDIRRFLISFIHCGCRFAVHRTAVLTSIDWRLTSFMWMSSSLRSSSSGAGICRPFQDGLSAQVTGYIYWHLFPSDDPPLHLWYWVSSVGVRLGWDGGRVDETVWIGL